MVTVANAGRVLDITDIYFEGIRWDVEAALFSLEAADEIHIDECRAPSADELRESHAGHRRLRVYCGGCPYVLDTWVPQVMLEDTALVAGDAWVVAVGFAANPIRCPYCTGQMSRPEGADAAPYPVKETA